MTQETDVETIVAEGEYLTIRQPSKITDCMSEPSAGGQGGFDVLHEGRLEETCRRIREGLAATRRDGST